MLKIGDSVPFICLLNLLICEVLVADDDVVVQRNCRLLEGQLVRLTLRCLFVCVSFTTLQGLSRNAKTVKFQLLA